MRNDSPEARYMQVCDPISFSDWPSQFASRKADMEFRSIVIWALASG